MTGTSEIRVERLRQDFRTWDALLALILRSFAYMHPRIDPPSSALKLTPDTLAEKASREVVFVATVDGVLAGCAFLAEREDHFYLGKVAVDPALQGKGIGGALLDAAEAHALATGKTVIELQTRVELTENHAFYNHLGFVETQRTPHPGFDRPTSVTFRKVLA